MLYDQSGSGKQFNVASLDQITTFQIHILGFAFISIFKCVNPPPALIFVASIPIPYFQLKIFSIFVKNSFFLFGATFK
jgi:hypothetical protein